MVRSLPGLGAVLGARVLGEFGDDRTGMPPPVSQELRRNITDHQSLRHQARRPGPPRPQPAPRRRHLPLGLFRPQASPGARAYYDHRRAAGDTHHAALRALGNRLVGILHGCLDHHAPYSETTAWRPPRQHQPQSGRLTLPAVGCLARLGEASGDGRGRLAQPRLGARQLVLGAVLP